MGHLSRRRAVGMIPLAAVVLVNTTARLLAAERAPLAIKGYDPVAYFTDGKPEAGKPEIEYEWDEYRYRFASAEHRALFKANPARYAPQFQNLCAMALSKGEVQSVNPKYWLIVDGKLYLFGKPNGPQLFKRNLADNVYTAEQSRALIHKN